MKKIGKGNWKRKTIYDNFIKYSSPVFSIATRLNVTKTLEFCKKNNISFFPTFLYFVTCCANEIEEMRTRLFGTYYYFKDTEQNGVLFAFLTPP